MLNTTAKKRKPKRMHVDSFYHDETISLSVEGVLETDKDPSH